MERLYTRVVSFSFIALGIFSILGFRVPSKISGWIEPSFSYGMGMILLGLLFLTISFFIKKEEYKVSKCPKCKEVFDYSTLKNGKCPISR